jgi:hypothetical protein
MSQNRSHAVMQQRSEADDSLDDFPTQPWGTRALIEKVLTRFGLFKGPVWEPACNRGFMARPLSEYFNKVYSTDVHNYGWAGMHAIADFLFPSTSPPSDLGSIAWTITNPPFRLAEEFIAKARATSTVGCAMLVRSAFLEGVGRYNRLFSVTPPTVVAQFVERLPMVKGRVDPKASTATSYAWLVWAHGVAPQPTFWIPPCRAKLERADDYPQVEVIPSPQAAN